MAGGQSVSVRTATAKPFKSQGATNMSNDRAQELTAKINQSITALCAETDAAKQSETYLAWLSTVSRFYKYSFLCKAQHKKEYVHGRTMLSEETGSKQGALLRALELT
jgi:hypothetical protein